MRAMSRRNADRFRRDQERGGAPAPAGPEGTSSGPRPSERPPRETDRPAQPSGTSAIAATALLPLRFFFGFTFLYAGFDKLASPTFLDASSPTSIQAQMQAFARISPIAGLVRFGEPLAVPIGLLIALGEIAIGLGALTGLAFRVAAAGGAALSLLFWLTASWGTHPFYYGADLPYAAGWLVLATAGHGNVLVPARFTTTGAARSPQEEAERRRRIRRGEPEPAIASPARRAVLQTGLLALLALVASSLAAPLRGLAGLGEEGIRTAAGGPTPLPSTGPTALGSGGPTPGATPEGSIDIIEPSAGPSSAPTATPSSAPSAQATPQPTPRPSVGGIPVARIADVEKQRAVAFTIPYNAPAPLPAGDPGIVVQLPDGRFVAYDAACTHEGCPVEWDAQDGVLLCPCHGAAFDAANHAAVLAGPTNTPLAGLAIVADTAAGTINLKT